MNGNDGDFIDECGTALAVVYQARLRGQQRYREISEVLPTWVRIKIKYVGMSMYTFNRVYIHVARFRLQSVVAKVVCYK